MCVQLFPEMDSSPEAYGTALASHIMVGAPSFLTPKEPSYTCAVSPLPQGGEICDHLIFYSNRV